MVLVYIGTVLILCPLLAIIGYNLFHVIKYVITMLKLGTKESKIEVIVVICFSLMIIIGTILVIIGSFIRNGGA